MVYIKKNQVRDELKKLDDAIKSTISNLKKIKDKINPSIKNNIGLLFDTHIMLVNDTGFIGNIKNRIKNNLNSPEWAIYSEYLSIKESFDDIDDTYFKQRIDEEGIQTENYPKFDPYPFLDKLDASFTLKLRERDVFINVYKYEYEGVKGEKIPIFFLPTDIFISFDVVFLTGL